MEDFNQDNQNPEDLNTTEGNNQQFDDNVNFTNRIDLTELQEGITQIKEEISKVIVGQKNMIDMLIAALLANGHALIEGVPEPAIKVILLARI